MWIISGLGNPGAKYAKTRHNVGFSVIDSLSKEFQIELSEKELYAIGKGSIEGRGVVLLKPLTYMNRSGAAVKKVVQKCGISPEQLRDHLVVIHDDLDLAPGVVKLRKNGSSGGHKGIESLIVTLGTREFLRIKIGIGRDSIPVEEYVLKSFKPEEKPLIKDAVARAADAVVEILTEGIESAMSRFNRSPKERTGG